MPPPQCPRCDAWASVEAIDRYPDWWLCRSCSGMFQLLADGTVQVGSPYRRAPATTQTRPRLAGPSRRPGRGEGPGASPARLKI